MPEIDLLRGLIAFGFLLCLGVFLLIRNRYAVYLFVPVFLGRFIMTVLLHHYSFVLGRQGFNPLTRVPMMDDQIYHGGATLLVQGLASGNLMEAIRRVPVEHETLTGFTVLIAIVYLLSGGPNLLVGKVWVCWMGSLVPSVFLLIVRALGMNRKQSLLFALPVVFYPMHNISSFQLQKDSVILLSFLLALWFSVKSTVLRRRKLSRLSEFFASVILAGQRFYIGIAYIVSRLHRRRTVFVLLVLVLLVVMIYIFGTPDLLELVVLYKTETLGIGDRNGIFVVDYSSLPGILLTYVHSLRYFFFSPLPFEFADQGLLWALTGIDTFFLFYAFGIILFQRKRVRDEHKWLLWMLVLFVISASIATVTIQSSIHHYMRIRLPVYIAVYLISALKTVGVRTTRYVRCSVSPE